MAEILVFFLYATRLRLKNNKNLQRQRRIFHPTCTSNSQVSEKPSERTKRFQENAFRLSSVSSNMQPWEERLVYVGLLMTPPLLTMRPGQWWSLMRAILPEALSNNCLPDTHFSAELWSL